MDASFYVQAHLRPLFFYAENLKLKPGVECAGLTERYKEEDCFGGIPLKQQRNHRLQPEELH
ncbi:MAG: hypothetical protein WC418_04210 [Candidatus Omnitrophota bacterium]|jgi:hypothetical protein